MDSAAAHRQAPHKPSWRFFLPLTKKDAQGESGELSFIWGKMRTAAWKRAPQIAQIDCSKEAVLCLVTQSCPPLCKMDCSPPGSSVHGILQARILEWIAMPSSRGSSQPRDQTQVSCIAGRFFTFWATREAQRGSGGRSIRKTLVKGECNAVKPLLYKRFSASPEELMSPWRDFVIF